MAAPAQEESQHLDKVTDYVEDKDLDAAKVTQVRLRKGVNGPLGTCGAHPVRAIQLPACAAHGVLRVCMHVDTRARMRARARARVRVSA